MNARMVEFNANKPQERRFLGKLDTSGLSKRERNFEKKHLKAYLAGHVYVIPPRENTMRMLIGGVKVQQFVGKATGKG